MHVSELYKQEMACDWATAAFPLQDCPHLLRVNNATTKTPPRRHGKYCDLSLLLLLTIVQAPAKAAATKKRRGRPPGSRKSDIAPAAPSKAASKHSVAKPSTKRKGRPPQDGEDELSAITTSDTQSKRVKRRTQLDLDEIAGETPKSKKKYVQLEERTKRIPVEQLETWPQMSKQLLEHIAAVMQNAKRDIANAQRDERKVITAYEALNPMIRKLERELARARAPLQANDMQFNIDKLTEKNAAVSRDVTTARHSKQQLTDQVKVADQLLRKDEENLEELKRDAKRWSTEWKQQQKRGRARASYLHTTDWLTFLDTPLAPSIRGYDGTRRYSG